MTLILTAVIGTLLMTGFMFAILYGVGGAIALFAPSFDASIDAAITELGVKFNTIYHIIPGAGALVIILSTILVLTLGYFFLRFGIFIYNEVTHSGGAV